jgi:hypothetical protein
MMEIFYIVVAVLMGLLASLYIIWPHTIAHSIRCDVAMIALCGTTCWFLTPQQFFTAACAFTGTVALTLLTLRYHDECA